MFPARLAVVRSVVERGPVRMRLHAVKSVLLFRGKHRPNVRANRVSHCSQAGHEFIEDGVGAMPVGRENGVDLGVLIRSEIESSPEIRRKPMGVLPRRTVGWAPDLAGAFERHTGKGADQKENGEQQNPLQPQPAKRLEFGGHFSLQCDVRRTPGAGSPPV
jgi:hypothetical protein